ncbi:polysaccharide biosynthesis protein [Anaerosalibacter bizertensis]|uniref:Polysaccharide biosynthesis protein n=2 Tax=Anaerosalibacter bizertensis TaxID=932217 RepID=A0A9Q4AC86_9FIRM|nr:polysaccharide biosynthesis protein [Anaerosalibacter bizertensis]MBV1817033.1 polysaccharide biosynthesis protein [Bacteroidales bacterium MSK.15.36]MCB5558884.1 polysaccharide biosynthesis protein [Anaerosalibacter bizertensis]MCG4565243.1 polysaccharide biosynthesis protein [Anaerosalibacter bizertensis]MCG4582083.1 polysaccharide biosynthesis protein [Anaerosalibacter bizertensis]
MTKENFLKGAAILGVAGIIVKILGAFYRIPISNIIKTEGMGYYQTAYPLYVLLLTISTSGFPVAIAKLVSEKRAIGNYRGAHKVFKIALLGLFICGILTSLFVFVLAENIVEALGNRNAYYSLIALVPALFFVPIMSAFRGYFQGRQFMTPTAVSQISEQAFRVGTGLFLTYFLLDRGIPIAAGGASFGGSIGAIAGTIAMVLIYLPKRKDIRKEVRMTEGYYEETTGKIIKDLLIIAIPITIGSAIAPIMDTIDAAIVMRRLQYVGFSEFQANDLYGQLKGLAQTLINLPQVFSMALAISLVPAISDAYARNKKEEIKSIISSGVRVTLLIGLPCALGLFVLGKPIIRLLYFKNTAEALDSTGEILQYLSFGVIFLTLVQSLTAILQGLGRTMIPVRNLLIGAITKTILTYVLTGIPSVNVKGAAISTVVAYMIASTLDLISVKKYAKMEFKTGEVFIRPLISAIGMAIMAKVGHIVFTPLVGDRIATILAIFVGAIVYFLFLIRTGSITYDDFKLIPKGEKIANILVRLKLLKAN